MNALYLFSFYKVLNFLPDAGTFIVEVFFWWCIINRYFSIVYVFK